MMPWLCSRLQGRQVNQKGNRCLSYWLLGPGFSTNDNKKPCISNWNQSCTLEGQPHWIFEKHNTRLTGHKASTRQDVTLSAPRGPHSLNMGTETDRIESKFQDAERCAIQTAHENRQLPHWINRSCTITTLSSPAWHLFSICNAGMVKASVQ